MAEFTAVCGQKCGLVAVPSLETTHCPQCGHPLIVPAHAAPMPAPAAAPEIAGVPIVSTDGSITPSTGVTPSGASAAPATIKNDIARALEAAGYPADESDAMAQSAIDELEKRKAAPPPPAQQ